MTDQPAGYTWTNLVVRMTGTQSNVFLALLYQIKQFIESFSNPDGNVIILWTNSIYRPGSTNLQRLPDCLIKLQAYCDAHGGDPTGFLYMPEDVKWWSGLGQSFKAYAGSAGAKIWKLPLAQAVTVGIADTEPVWTVRAPNYEMDVSQVIERENEPTWFIVYQTTGYKWICLAGQTIQKPV